MGNPVCLPAERSVDQAPPAAESGQESAAAPDAANAAAAPGDDGPSLVVPEEFAQRWETWTGDLGATQLDVSGAVLVPAFAIRYRI